MVRFGVAIFLSAFLLFQVQPLMGKYILPWFGGGPAVWTICLLFFQVFLLMGYTYAHLGSSILTPRMLAVVHLVLLAASLLLLPIAPSSGLLEPGPEDAPTRQILTLLVLTVGPAYFLLSSTGPLMQRWFSNSFPGRSPYRLYALSNAGSLLGLLSYPFLVEPLLALENQIAVWSGAYLAFVVCSGWSAVRAGLWRGAELRPAEDGAAPDSSREGVLTAGISELHDEPPTATTVLLWLGLSAMGSAMLLATTNQMCQDVAAVPFLWILPLAIYLLTFILCFGHESRYDRRWFGLLVGVMVPLALVMMVLGPEAPLVNHLVVYSLTLFACCMVCHGELVKTKPHPRHLTLFYLTVAAGGALGGVAVALIAPQVFTGFWEFPAAMAGSAALTLVAWYRARAWKPYLNRPYWILAPMTGMAFAVVTSLILIAVGTGHEAVVRSRNFYGVLRLTRESYGDQDERLVLTNGRVLHGSQFVEEEKRSWPTAYYGRQSAIGLAMEHHPRRLAAQSEERRLRVGVVGLGAGTIAALARPGDYIRFYEINPDVVTIAERYFTFLKDTPAVVEVVTGDARVQMEAEVARNQPQSFDILAVDAFSSEAIPIHLLTRECLDTYWWHVRPEGLLLFHISNESLNLEPVVRGLARQSNRRALYIPNEGDTAQGVSTASWMLLTSNRDFLDLAEVQRATKPPPDPQAPPLLWRDDFASLWQVLRF